jgi:hypothetical protein
VPQGGDFDLFFSYSRADEGLAGPLHDALEATGLAVFFDKAEIDDFEGITGRVTEGVACSKALLAFYSETYPLRRACQFELTAAFLAAQRAGDPTERVLVVNPQVGAGHIEPVELRDALFRRAPAADDSAGMAEVAANVAEHVRALDGVLGGAPSSSAPWYGLRAIGSTRFVGRLPAMWGLHSALHAGAFRPLTGTSGPGVAQVRGLGGIGKTLLVEEYALRFGAAYPGGIFWLRASGADDTAGVTGADERRAERAGQMRALALDLGVPSELLASPEDVELALRAQLERHGKPFLWVVDDLPSGLAGEEVRAWLAPHPLGKTLITTRSREYGAIATPVEPGLLSPEEAYELLTTSRRPSQETEEAEARALAADLGYHALALAVASAALRRAGQKPFAEWRSRLANSTRDVLELAAELSDALPTGHQPSIASTLLRSIEDLGDEGKDLLRLASVLAAAPMPASLIERVFTGAEGLDEWEARDRADLARKQVDDTSLADFSGEGTVSVHGLVSRTVRFREQASPERRDRLRAATVDVLNRELAAVIDPRAHPLLELPVAHARELARHADNLAQAHLLGWVARYDYERGHYRSSESARRRESDTLIRLLGEKHPETLGSLSGLADTIGEQGDLAQARVLQQLVLDDYRELLGEQHPYTLRTMNNLATTLWKQGDRAGARRLYEHVLEARLHLLGEEHPDTLRSKNNVAGAWAALGDYAGARGLYEQVAKARACVLGAEHHLTLLSMGNLAEMLRTQGDLSGARELQERVLAGYRCLLGEDHPHTLRSMNNLAETLRAQGDVEGARASHERVLEGYTQLLGPNHAETLRSRDHLAESLRDQGELGAARSLHEEVFEARLRLLGKEHPDTLLSANNLAEALRDQGELAEARKLHGEVFEARRRLLGEEHPDTLRSMDNLAVTLRAQGELADVRGPRKIR